MGADGGICWVRVKDRDKFYELIKPFNLGWQEDMYEQYHDEYLHQYPLPSDYEVSTYGSFQINSGFITLERMLDEAEAFAEVYEDYNLWPEASFYDLIISEYTTPTWRGLSGSEITGVIVGRIRGWRLGPITKESVDRICMNPDDILAMSISHWATSLNDVIYRKTFGHAETWT